MVTLFTRAFSADGLCILNQHNVWVTSMPKAHDAAVFLAEKLKEGKARHEYDGCASLWKMRNRLFYFAEKGPT